MGVRDLFFSIKARDETGAAFNKVRNNLRTVDGMAATTSDRLRRLGGGLVRFGAGATAATAPIMFAFRNSLSLYDKQERAQAKVTQGVKSTGQAAGFAATELFHQASALQAITRFGDEDILNGVTAQLLTFTNIAGDQFLRAQTAALDLATVLDGDLQSSSIMLGKALNDPVKGLSAMSRAGITFSEDQAKVIKALAETGKMAEAQTLILQELEKQYGGQAQAAAKAGLGAMARLSNSWGDLKESVGGALAEILPPMVNFFDGMVKGFQALPEPIQSTVVVLGLLTAIAGPAAIALGALTFALGAITAPVALVVGGIAALVGITAALWPNTEKVTIATDNVTLALGDEIVQSQLLSKALGTNSTMSVQVARTKLQEARARHENVSAIIAEQQALGVKAYRSSGFDGELSDLRAMREAMGSRTADGWNVSAVKRDMFDQTEARIVELVKQRQALLEADSDMTEQLRLTEENITSLETALADAENGVVSFGDGLIEPIAPAERLSDALGGSRVNGGAGVVGALDVLGNKALETKGILDGFGKETADMLKDMFADGKLTLRDFGDFILEWGNQLLDKFLTAVFDPLGDALQSLFDGMFSGGGGGGLFGGLFSGIGNIFGGLIGMDTGGEMQVKGRNGIDRNIASFRVSSDENIKVVKRGQPDGRPVNVYIQTPDPAAFKASRGQLSAQISRAVGAGARFT